MGGVATAGQLRMAFVRRLVLAVPLVLLLGLASGWLSNSGYTNRWFAGLAKPTITPPGWVFAVAWTILYILQGTALAIVLSASRSSARAVAVAAFAVQLALNLAWSPLFFRAHRIAPALWLIVAIVAAAALSAWAFARVRRRAALLMLPYIGWLLFAGYLNYRILVLNPVAARGASTQISF